MRFYNRKKLLILLLIILPLFSQEIEEEEIEEPALVEEIYEKEFIKINVNKADYQELLNIPGISRKLAKEIIKERKKAFFTNFEDFKNRLNLSPDYEYLENYLDFNLLIFNFYQETKGYYNDKYGENRFYRSVKGKVKGVYSLIDFGIVHYQFKKIDKFYGEIKYRRLKVIGGNYVFEYGKGLLFGKYYAFSSELFYIPSRLKRLKPTISYSRNIGIKGGAISYNNLDMGFGFERDSFYTFFISYPIEKLQIVPLTGFLKDLKTKKTLPFFSITGSFYGPFYLFTETGYVNNNIYTYTGIRKIYDFSRIFIYFYSLPVDHINYFNTKYDWKREGKDEKGAGIRWEGKWKKLILRIDERFFEKSDKRGGYESYIRGYLKLKRPFIYTFELKDRKTSIHRLRFKNEISYRKKDLRIKYKLYFEWDSYLKTAPGVLGGVEIKKGIFFAGFYSFNINNYNKRIYVYEAEPPTSFYLAPLYGNGSRIYFGTKLKAPMLYILTKYSENISDRVSPDRRIIFILSVKNY